MNQILMNILYIIITTFGVALVVELFKFIDSKVDELQTNEKIAKYVTLNKLIDTAQSAIETSVLAVSQTYVDALKADGKFTNVSAGIAKAKAIEIAKSLISVDAKNAIIELYSDFEKYLDTKIEAVVKAKK